MRTWLIVVWIRLNAAIRSKTCIAATLLCAAVLLVPALADMPTGAAYLYDADSVQTQSAFLDEQVAAGTYDSAPDELKQLVQEEQEAYHRALAEAPEYTAAYYEALADQQEAFAREGDAGYVDGGISPKSLEAAYALTAGVSKLGAPQHYASMRNMPGLLYLAALPGIVPYPLWFVPALVALWAIHAKRGKSFVDQAPLPASAGALSYAVAGFAAACVATAVMIAPAFLVSTALNGLGDVAYPTVFIQDGAIIQRGCLMQVLTEASLLVALLFELSFVASFALATARSARASLAATLLLMAPQTFDLYHSDSMPWYSVLKYLPTTYFDFRTAAGFFSYANGADICTSPGADFAHGIVVTIALAILAAADHLALCHTKRHQRWGWATPHNEALPGDLTLSVRGLCAAFSRTPLLEDASLTLCKGAVSGLIAPNGHGKTTLLKLLNGSGAENVKARGELAFEANLGRTRTYLVPDYDDACFSYLKVNDTLRYAAALFGRKANQSAVINALGIEGILGKRANKCSAGNRQLVSIALGLIANPAVLMLDEPMSALDPINTERVSNSLRRATQSGTAVILSSHNLENLRELCDSFLFIRNHHIERLEEKGGTEQNLSQLFKEWYGTN